MPSYQEPAYQPADFTYDNWAPHLAPAFRSALQNIYGRGLDISSNAPWQLLDQAFPQATSAQLRQGRNDELLNAARMFMSGQTPQRPGMVQPEAQWFDDTGSGASNTGSAGLPGIAAISGPNAGLIGTGLGVAGVALPGNPGMIASILGNILGSETVNSALPSNMTAQLGDGKTTSVAALKTGAFQGMLNALTGGANLAFGDAALTSLVGQNPSLLGDPAFMAAPYGGKTISEALTFGNVAPQGSALGFTEGGPHPSFGFLGFNTPSITIAIDDEGNAIGTGAGPGTSGPSTGNGGIGAGNSPGNTGEGGPGTGPGGSPGSGSGPGAGVGSASAGVGGPGTGGGAGDPSGGGQSMKRGGVVRDTHKGFARKKGSHVVPIKAHSGEFVVNKNATDAARPALEALNEAIPPQRGRDLAKIMDEAKKYFEVAV